MYIPIPPWVVSRWQLLEKRRSQLAKKEENEYKLRDIGTVPADVEQFKTESSKRVGGWLGPCGRLYPV